MALAGGRLNLGSSRIATVTMNSEPSAWMSLPFVGLLTAIALAPLIFGNWWSRHYPKVVLGLAMVTVLAYAGVQPLEHILRTAHEYVTFLCLIGSLFVISGGIHIIVKGEATPRVNVLFLFLGTFIANVLGTTGASMLLIRPWLRMNKYRLTGHHVVFFIFLISNVGGALTPIGDPPLFLGYLEGVPFWWVARNGWLVWLVGIGILLMLFMFIDTANFRRAPLSVRDLETGHEEWRFQGLLNLVFLAVVLGAVFVKTPPFCREALMVGAAVASFITTPRRLHEANDFSFQPLKEVAILFAGIFSTMMPALDWLQGNAGRLGDLSPGFFFWGSGALSSVLDNAPTYLSFLSVAFGADASSPTLSAISGYIQSHGETLSGFTSGGPYDESIRTAIAALRISHPDALALGKVSIEQIQMGLLLGHPTHKMYLLALSFGAVFFGANTYIGNGPNLMVKAIADQQKCHTPGFLAYIFRFTLPFMLPMLFLVWLLFFRSTGDPIGAP
jgi:Na+/H+ antiporter NhaD/arsenite permease-like protein